MQIDFTDDASVGAAAREITDNFSRLDILANNAGIGWCTNFSAWDAMRQVLAISVVGVVSVNEAFLPLLRISTAPRLIFVSLTTPSITIAADPNGLLHG